MAGINISDYDATCLNLINGLYIFCSQEEPSASFTCHYIRDSSNSFIAAEYIGIQTKLKIT